MNGADIVFSVTDNGGDRGSATVTNINSAGTYSFDYNEILADNSAVDLTNVRKVEMELLDIPPSFDATFDLVESAYDPSFPYVATVPFEFSPSLGLIIGGGFLGFNIWKQKQKTPNIKQS